MAKTAPIRLLRPTTVPYVRAFVILFLIAAAGVMFFTHRVLTERFSVDLQIDSQLAGSLYSGNMVTRLRQQQLVPQLLARDPVLIGALQSGDFTVTSQRLIEVAEEIAVSSLTLLDMEGRVVAASDRSNLGAIDADKPYFVSALRDLGTIFTLSDPEDGNAVRFHYARKVVDQTEPIGVVVVEVDLRIAENNWRNRNELVTVTDPSDRVILSSNPEWRNNTLTNVIAEAPPPSTVRRLLGTTARNTVEQNPHVWLNGERMLRTEIKTGFRGWRLTYFSSLSEVRSQVNAFLALEGLILTLTMLALLFLANKRLARQTRLIAEESDQLRLLNARLSAEIEERQRVERDLETAEQSLEQASKLAAIGQMSAAISHELNQPLAAMRTYLAGARLLLQRKRVDEALSSFHRIDDLLARMGAITGQMKSYARKGNDALAEVDLRDAVDGSLSMMAPQLGRTRIEVRKTLPSEPVIVRADPIRLDQIIVNLLRNAIEAAAEEDQPMIDILVVQGRQVTLSIRDNGHGLEDPDKLFEPFYTTKKPGEGVGLGLAISAGIAKELGGRLTARNAEPQGAVFELRLPRADRKPMPTAAE